ncbi:MAG TPA: hypothetical protein VED40_21575 [Azospirillaceae bacterium]|nr:hypothetical protein [Azospirillaceae bacterium]
MGRILLWCQPLLPGDGADMAALAEALSRLGAKVALLWGGASPPPLTGVTALPPARLADPAGPLLLDAAGEPLSHAWKKRRAAAALAAAVAFAPDLLVLDRYPFARRGFRFELRPLAERGHQHGVPVACRRPPGAEEPPAGSGPAGPMPDRLSLDPDPVAAARALLPLRRGSA